jgi:D-alanyl-D-alanine carboxypeptidase/D-alanyl-D-alanine-endopeptidase (penicillin-binding protein 4)
VANGVHIIKADNCEIEFSRNADLPLMPASNMKILTTAVALDVLGQDYKFSTKVYFQNGNIVVKGSGDPLLGDAAMLEKRKLPFGWEFDEIIKAVKTHNISDVNDIIVDSSVFDDMLVNPSWPADQLNRDYVPQVSGINYNGNIIEIIAYPSGGAAAYSKKPDTGYISINNQAAVTRQKSNTVWVSRAPNTNKMTLYGKCYQKTLPIAVTIHRPAVYFGYMLAERLIKENTNLSGSII